VDALEKVGIANAEARAREYPHQMSGGMCQRVMIAMALACEPALLIADEPTTALDVTIQAQILRLIARLQRQMGMALLLITHNLGVVAQMADRVMVMYAGQIVEDSPADRIFTDPAHPYTYGLLRAIPPVGHRERRLRVIPGEVPNPMFFPKGCRFAPRCPYAAAGCGAAPPLRPIGAGRSVRCHHPLAEDKMGAI
jgi:oligopeptide/dipeptide ABC transporter ATP-binding protein